MNTKFMLLDINEHPNTFFRHKPSWFPFIVREKLKVYSRVNIHFNIVLFCIPPITLWSWCVIIDTNMIKQQVQNLSYFQSINHLITNSILYSFSFCTFNFKVKIMCLPKEQLRIHSLVGAYKSKSVDHWVFATINLAMITNLSFLFLGTHLC